MKIVDQGGSVAVLCDRCLVTVQGKPASVALHGSDIRVYHDDPCLGQHDTFLRLDADRTVSVEAFLAELQAAI